MPHLYYIHDPMCSWCWAFRPTLEKLLQQLPADIKHSRLLGGLAPDTRQPMPKEMRDKLQNTWRRIQAKLPETRFNYDFWEKNTPRRSTYPACRAVISAREIDSAKEESMILAIQQAYYLNARNPSDDATLIALAGEIGLDRASFNELYTGHLVEQTLNEEIEKSRRMGASSFPSLVLQIDQGYWPVAIDYHNEQSMLANIEQLCST